MSYNDIPLMVVTTTVRCYKYSNMWSFNILRNAPEVLNGL